MTDNPPNMFYAYASFPSFVGEAIEKFSTEFNKSDQCHVIIWPQMEIDGLAITEEIFRNIDSCDVFACDLTTLNLNVLFELGYALAKQKKLWITINQEMDGATSNYDEFRILRNIGYFSYSNAQDLLNEFYSRQIYGSDRISLSKQLSLFSDKDYLDIFAIKSPSRLDSINAPIELIRASRMKSIIDDAAESPFYRLDWYCKNLFSAEGVLFQFMSNIQSNRESHNIKTAFMFGIAKGLEKPTLVLAQKPFKIPSDLPNLVDLFDNSKQSRSITQNWILDIARVKEVRDEKKRDYKARENGLARLGSLRIGQIVAEDESDTLLQYFVQTSAYNEVIYGSQTIFVGRKGTGKSANLVAAQQHFAREKSNLVIQFNPVGYEIENLMILMASFSDNSHKGFFTDSLWKYLIYTEIATMITQKYRNHPDSVPTYQEQELLSYISERPYLFADSFAERITHIIEGIATERSRFPNKDVRSIIGTVLQSGVLRNLQRLVYPVLESYANLIILVDNLDKGWNDEADTQAITDIIFSLMSLSKHLPDEITREVKSKFNLKVKMTIFIRSDIYSIMQQYAREKDKFLVYKIEWKDKHLLGRVLDQRIMFGAGLDSPIDAWRDFFETKNDGEDIKDFVISNIRPRPRDAITLMGFAISKAFNSGHPKVREEDLKLSLEAYSSWAYDSLLEEDDPNKGKMKDIIDEFINDKYIYTKSEVDNLISRCVTCQDDMEYYFSLLCDTHFFEIEVKPNQFEIVEDQDARINKLKVASKMAVVRESEVHLRINKPFRIHLGIE